MAALNKLLALLELGRHGGDPIDNPAPWSWGPWMEHFQVDRAPWSGPRWKAKTGVSRENWESSRAFVVAYHAAGDNPTQRHYFATSLTGGQLFAGLQLLLNKFEADWQQAAVDKLIEVILESMGIKVLDELHVEIDSSRASVPNIACLLFGNDAFQQPSVLHPAVAVWILDLLRETMARWTDIHNEIVHTAERLQRDVYIACKGNALRPLSTTSTVSLTTLPRRLERIVRSGTRHCLLGSLFLPRQTTHLHSARGPPATARTLSGTSLRDGGLHEWGRAINSMLCGETLALSVGVMESMYLEADEEQEAEDWLAWGDEDRAAFWFACQGNVLSHIEGYW
ncbi:hypothetical protein LXA43DRAFT_1063073 [Ganoderma leucocontextum]|nr:hypothetical protein LXA43DRAFT_1063073 [Ganoderma leucocontextum]